MKSPITSTKKRQYLKLTRIERALVNLAEIVEKNSFKDIFDEREPVEETLDILGIELLPPTRKK